MRSCITSAMFMSTLKILTISSSAAFVFIFSINIFVIPPVEEVKTIAIEEGRKAQQIELAKSVRESAMLYISWALILSASIVLVIEGKLSFLKQEFGFFRLFIIPFILLLFFFSIYYGLSLNHSVTGFLSTRGVSPDLQSPLHLNYWNKQFSFFSLGLFFLLIFFILSFDVNKIKRVKSSE